jgi:hypothetical protein
LHIQHIESTSGHTGNISGPPLHNTQLTFDTLLCSPVHRISVLSLLSLITKTNIYLRIASLENSRSNTKHSGTPGQRVIKGPAKRKKTRRRQTKQRNTSNDISDKNGTCTSQLMRMHEIKTGFI